MNRALTPYRFLWLKTSILLPFFSLCAESLAGPVQSPNGFPASSMNSDANFINAGNDKLVVSWNGKTTGKMILKSAESRYFTDIIDSQDPNRISAIACGNEELFLYTPNFSSRYPAGEIRKQSIGKLSGCALSRNSDVGIITGQTVMIGSWQRTFEQPVALVKFNDGFVVVSKSGWHLLTSQFDGTWKIETHTDSDFAQITSDTSFSSNGSLIAFADDGGLRLWSSKLRTIRVGVSPCTSSQICGVSLAKDNSWMIAGSFGTWIGLQNETSRMRLPLLSRDIGGTAIAHSGANGSFVYLGNDDGDAGRIDDVQGRQRDPGYSNTPIDSDTIQEIQFDSTSPAELLASWDWRADLGIDTARSYAQQRNIQALPVIVGVIDSGLDLEHPAFKIPNRNGEIPWNQLDDDSNGFVDDLVGYNFVTEQGIPQDKFGHGSHVAGIIHSYNGKFSGVAENAVLLPSRALDSAGKSNSLDLARSIYYAVNQGAEVLNCSWGGGSSTEALRAAFEYAVSKNVMVFSSSGNDKLNTDTFPQVPKNYPGVLSVGATTQSGKLASFSNFGRQSVFTLAPGDKIYSVRLGGGFFEKSGTSMASPSAAGTAAWLLGLAKQLSPNLTPQQRNAKVIDAMCRSGQKTTKQWSKCGKLSASAATEILIQESL